MQSNQTQSDLRILLNDLIQTWENETIEFKQASGEFTPNEIGKYFSALSNEARLNDKKSAWLIFGVNDKTKCVVGSDYKLNAAQLKNQIYQNTSPKASFRQIHEIDDYENNGSNKRVILFEIYPAPIGQPIAWKGHYYGRAGESLVALPLDKLDQLRYMEDWSAQVIPEANINDLDEIALERAKSVFIEKNTNRFPLEMMEKWSIETFLDKAKITKNGQITRTALLLLGKPESSHFLSPNPVQITWKLDAENKAYQHFSIPYLQATTQIYQKIRNFQLRLLPRDQLVPKEVAKYDQKSVLEALHNCIAHQDYQLNARVVVTEKNDRLIFENYGSFFEGKPEDYFDGSKTPHRYRNSFLTQAMVSLNMIDTMGYGISQINERQIQRYLPLPDYDLTQQDQVKLTIYGDVVSEAYTQALMNNSNLLLADVLALDRIQKKLPIEDAVAKRLRKQKLIEGRKPNYLVSLFIPNVTTVEEQVAYIHNKGQDEDFCTKFLLDYLAKFDSVDRNAINQLLFPLLSNNLNEQQKFDKISNLLTKLRRKLIIKNMGSAKKPQWVLIKENAE